MSLARKYSPQEVEPRLQEFWQSAGIYEFKADASAPVYSIDTPPPTVSGELHLGHVYSYTHPDLIARFWRMRGCNVYYPMGFDDNGLPTERLVEKRLKITALQVGREAFIQKCLQISEDAERDYLALWQRLGLSIDWRYTYRTIDDRSRRIAQHSFVELYHKGLAYRGEAPAIWCPECRTSIAQAELEDLERPSEFVTLRFPFSQGSDSLPIATTRPELLPACVAIFVHPDDTRYRGFAGQKLRVPLFGQEVPVFLDPGADPQKGTGAVMCCTFGDTVDVGWWRSYKLPLVEAIGRNGRMTANSGPYTGMRLQEARLAIKQDLEQGGFLLGRQPTIQSLRVHERCDTPVEYIIARQWFIRLLDFKETLLNAGEQVNWHPEHMQARYRAWVQNLNWDWCISRQRYFGVPFPVWYCQTCGEITLADLDQLPVDPQADSPPRPCAKCGSDRFIPEEDILDTWATSSMSPQIVGGWLAQDSGDSQNPLYTRVFPFSLRPQAHEIIRTWAFYTITKSHFHFGAVPWKDVLISGWGIAGEGMGKISKSRGGGSLPPLEMIQRYSADAVRYWAASASPGKDSVISEGKVQMGAKLVTKLWNVARFAGPFLTPPPLEPASQPLTPADRWVLSRAQTLIRRVTSLLETYEYANAKSEIESFFWGELTDNYLEMCKQRLYDPEHPAHQAARAALNHVFLRVLKLLAPYLPYITEEIYQAIFLPAEMHTQSDLPGTQPVWSSIHRASWPEPETALEDAGAERLGAFLVEIATAVRRYKSEHNLPLGSELACLQLIPPATMSVASLKPAEADIKSITRARQVEVVPEFNPGLLELPTESGLRVAIQVE